VAVAAMVGTAALQGRAPHEALFATDGRPTSSEVESERGRRSTFQTF